MRLFVWSSDSDRFRPVRVVTGVHNGLTQATGVLKPVRVSGVLIELGGWQRVRSHVIRVSTFFHEKVFRWDAIFHVFLR